MKDIKSGNMERVVHEVDHCIVCLLPLYEPQLDRLVTDMGVHLVENHDIHHEQGHDMYNNMYYHQDMPNPGIAESDYYDAVRSDGGPPILERIDGNYIEYEHSDEDIPYLERSEVEYPDQGQPRGEYLYPWSTDGSLQDEPDSQSIDDDLVNIVYDDDENDAENEEDNDDEIDYDIPSNQAEDNSSHEGNRDVDESSPELQNSEEYLGPPNVDGECLESDDVSDRELDTTDSSGKDFDYDGEKSSQELSDSETTETALSNNLDDNDDYSELLDSDYTDDEVTHHERHRRYLEMLVHHPNEDMMQPSTSRSVLPSMCLPLPSAPPLEAFAIPNHVYLDHMSMANMGPAPVYVDDGAIAGHSRDMDHMPMFDMSVWFSEETNLILPQLRTFFALKHIFKHPLNHLTTQKMMLLVQCPSHWLNICNHCGIMINDGIRAIENIKRSRSELCKDFYEKRFKSKVEELQRIFINGYLDNVPPAHWEFFDETDMERCNDVTSTNFLLSEDDAILEFRKYLHATAFARLQSQVYPLVAVTSTTDSVTTSSSTATAGSSESSELSQEEEEEDPDQNQENEQANAE